MIAWMMVSHCAPGTMAGLGFREGAAVGAVDGAEKRVATSVAFTMGARCGRLVGTWAAGVEVETLLGPGGVFSPESPRCSTLSGCQVGESVSLDEITATKDAD